MKKILFALAPIAVAASLAFNAGDTLPIGSKLPQADLKMMDVKTGNKTSVKESMGQNGVLVMFTCNTCPYVIKNQDRTLEIAKFSMDNGVGVILVNSNEAQRNDVDSYDAMKAYYYEQKYAWSYVVDGKSVLADAFGATRTPECFLFDKNEKLVYHGAIDDNPSDASAVSRKHLEKAVDALVHGNEIEVKETKSVGCSIKRNK